MSSNYAASNLFLCVTNDGNGDVCGYSYTRRCEQARVQGNIKAFRDMAGICAKNLVKTFGAPKATKDDITRAGDALFEYYQQHIKEVDYMGKGVS